MKSLNEIAAELERMDPANATDEEVLQLMRQIPQVALPGFELLPGQRILRCRTQGGAFPLDWKSEKDLSYHPNPAKAGYGRASLRGNAAFYGAMGRPDEFEESKMLSIHEVNELMHNPDFEHEEEYAVVGKWDLTGAPVNVIAVVQDPAVQKKNTYIREVFEEYLTKLEGSPYDKEGSVRLSTILAQEFLKKVDRKDGVGYKISAAFSHWAMERGMAGIAYPSARAQGDSNAFNVAIQPAVIDQEFTLSAVYGYRLLKESADTLIPYPYLGDTHVNGDFVWQDVGHLERPELIIEEIRADKRRQAEAAQKDPQP